MQRSILYVDPDEDAQDRVQEALQDYDDLSATIVSDVDTAFTHLDDHDEDYDIVVGDVTVGEEKVERFFTHIQEKHVHIPCVVFTELGLDRVMEDHTLYQASAYVKKDQEDAFDQLVGEIDELMQPRSSIDYPIPENEDARLKAIEKLDVARLEDEEAFDRLTELAKSFFDVNVAFVGIVHEDVEWFLSFAGDEVHELARECSICTFGILSDDTTVIEDSQDDERFKYINELREMDIVFYAGQPIINEQGYRIGMFCIADDEPREFSHEQRMYLKLFAEEVAELIRLYEGEN